MGDCVKRKRTEDLNSALEALDAQETRTKRIKSSDPAGERVPIGNVEHFYDHISVAAVRLTGDLKVGDTIEMENEEYTIRQRISSMQINRKDVNEATNGDDVGIRVVVPVRRGSTVYRL